MRWGMLRTGVTAVVLAASLAFAAEEARLEKARQLFEQATPHIKAAMDPDADSGDRARANKEAIALLRQARDEFQAWQAANGENADDPIGKEIGSLFFMMRKMAGVYQPPPKPAEPRPEPKPAPPSPGDGGGTAPPPPPSTPPKPDPAQLARDAYAKLQEAEKQYRNDLGVLKELYEQFLVDHPDTSLPEYTKAVTRLGEIQEQINASFKKAADVDPDVSDRVDSTATGKVMNALKIELGNSKDPEVRRKCAKLLGLTRSGAASYALVLVLRDNDAELVKIAKESLIQIGGTRTAGNLASQFRNSTADAQMAAVDVLEGIARKGPVDARTASPTLGKFALSNDGPVARRCLDVLVSLGYDGGPGLVEASRTKIPDKRREVIESIARVKYYPATRQVAFFLDNYGVNLQNPEANPAMKALKEMGIRTTPYLIDCLGEGGKLRQYSAWALREITGQQFGMDQPKQWRKWWDDNKPADAK